MLKKLFGRENKRILLRFGVSIFSLSVSALHATEFNINVLDVDERQKVDLSHFSDPDYVTPGEYLLSIRINTREIQQSRVQFLPAGPNSNKPTACITPDIANKLALTKEASSKIVLWNNDECADLTPISGVKISNRIGMGDLDITIPQAWLRYSDASWTPPEQWDAGINGVLLDYNLVGTARRNTNNMGSDRYLSSYGTTGFNLGAWRYRADYRYFRQQSCTTQRDQFSWDQFYAYRPLPMMSADLRLGEMFSGSNLFDSYRLTGISLENNENMLPPSLRGYAPEIRGVARSNARVTVTQNGRVIHETTVPAGPFAIQSLRSGISGTMNVEVTEEDGSVSRFQTEAANLPYLTRPGHVKYKLSAGRPSNTDHHFQSPVFSSAEASWGLSSSWSVYGGTLLSDSHQSWAAGVGKNLYLLGALTADVTQSRASLEQAPSTLMGHSFSLNWSKFFDSIESQVSFAGYRFSERTFMRMPQFLSALNYDNAALYSEKERYSITLSKNFSAEGNNSLLSGMSTYLTYTHSTFWNASEQDRYGVSLNKYFDIVEIKGISANLSAYKTKYNNQRTDDSIYLSFSIPLRDKERVSYSAGSFNSKVNQTLAYTNNRATDSNWNLSTRYNDEENSYFSGNYNYLASTTDASVSMAWQQNRYTFLSGSLRGGITSTQHGVAAHPKGNNGGTRIMVDTDGQPDVPFAQSRATTNRAGIAVIADTSSYYDVSTRIDVQKLPKHIEATTNVLQGTLTEGAIGYRKFTVVSGAKILASIMLENGKSPPFATRVKNSKGRDVAIVADQGQAYITGVSENETLSVFWDGKAQCQITLPATVSYLDQLLLPCK
ncbi:MAG: fimbria/pilus outer membrane usher protein [Symbiopectobacterium sp.]|uniref:fimbria/pilus outer membrane usher protein n=1 Tax=Symbiopectobacterium sp. TaxID=2952789 RepID=UPI0039EA5483